MTNLSAIRLWKALTIGATILLVSDIGASGQSPQDRALGVTARDIAQSQSAGNWWAHFKPTHDMTGKIAHSRATVGKPAPAPASPFLRNQPFNGQAIGATFYYPGDVSYHGGAVISAATQQLVLVNPPLSYPGNPSCSPANAGSCWGRPWAFMNDLNGSSFISIVNQYVGSSASNRYPPLANQVVRGSYPHIMYDSDIRAIVLASVNAGGGAGYGHIYHVFLPPGQDLCFDPTNSQCYSPDNYSTFYFCAYHGSFTVGGQSIVYSVEPYQDTNGCQVAPAAGHTVLQDSTNSTLSHEVFEAITDPDGNAWWVGQGGFYGSEIGDICHAPPAPTHLIGSENYNTQLEYSNLSHGCAATP